ncbi:MAG: hypothetical protein Q8P24_02100 [Desulfobacterales bacterium]|nr:hypothetical protein [Desulfobacterales bacterium]
MAKRIRREIYGDFSSRPEGRKYSCQRKDGKNKWVVSRYPYGTIANVGLRQQYQDAKRDYCQEGGDE